MAELPDCLSYSTGKVDKPPASCCGPVSEIAKKDIVCLCYIVQQAHNGTSQAVIDMGLKFDRLVNLPTVCKLRNADPKKCPSKFFLLLWISIYIYKERLNDYLFRFTKIELLGISANSPDYAIFNGTGTSYLTILSFK